MVKPIIIIPVTVLFLIVILPNMINRILRERWNRDIVVQGEIVPNEENV